jgi:hypothetical protein
VVQAKKKLIYSELEVADLQTYLSQPEREAEAPFDIIVSADVLQYLGDLRPLFDRVVPRLDPEQGLFAFTLEEFQVRQPGGHTLALPFSRSASGAMVGRGGGETHDSGLSIVMGSALALLPVCGAHVPLSCVRYVPAWVGYRWSTRRAARRSRRATSSAPADASSTRAPM